MRSSGRWIGRASTFGSTGLSATSALAFLALARWTGEAPPLAVWGGAVWVFLLSMIVSMPLVTAWIKQRSSETDDERGSP